MDRRQNLTVLTEPTFYDQITSISLTFDNKYKDTFQASSVEFRKPVVKISEIDWGKTIVAEFLLADNRLYERLLGWTAENENNDLKLHASIYIQNSRTCKQANIGIYNAVVLNMLQREVTIMGDIVGPQENLPTIAKKYEIETLEQYRKRMTDEIERRKPSLTRFRLIMED